MKEVKEELFDDEDVRFSFFVRHICSCAAEERSYAQEVLTENLRDSGKEMIFDHGVLFYFLLP